MITLKSYVKASLRATEAVVIWMHGLGSDAQNMMGLVEQLSIGDTVRHIFLNAPVRPVTLNQGMPMRAWYDITGLGLSNRDDRDGLAQSEAQITAVIQEQLAEGFRPDQIFLAGFSQGGAMALHTGLRLAFPIGGVIALSAYLPLATEHATRQPLKIPVFLAAGTTDTVVLPEWSRHVYEWLLSCDFSEVTWQEYAMEHTVCAREMRDVSQWLNNRMASHGAVS